MINKKIHVQVSVAAPLEKVWDYWTSPEHIEKWNFASDDWHCPKAENNLQDNNTFKYTMAAKDDSFRFDFCGRYDEVIQYEKISYTMEDGRKASIIFSQNGNETVIQETFEMENENAEDLQRNGWQAILNNFKKHVESQGNGD